MGQAQSRLSRLRELREVFRVGISDALRRHQPVEIEYEALQWYLLSRGSVSNNECYLLERTL